MITINPTAEAPTTDQRIAQLIRQFNNVTGTLAQMLASGIPVQAAVTNPQGVVVRPALDAVTEQAVSESLDRVIGSANHQAIVNALAVLNGTVTVTPVTPTPAPVTPASTQ